MKKAKKYSISFILIVGCVMSMALKAISIEDWMKFRLYMDKRLRVSQEITLSFAGDCTLGTYYGQGEWNRFDQVEKKKEKGTF